MASASLRMEPNLLTADQLKYELMIRSIFKSSDNQTRRRKLLETALYEEASGTIRDFDFSIIEMSVNVNETIQSYNNLVEWCLYI